MKKPVCTMVQKVLDDVAARRYCKPYYFMGEISYVMDETCDRIGGGVWKLEAMDCIFWRRVTLHRLDLDRYDTKVKLFAHERRLIRKAFRQVERNVKADKLALKMRARDWP